MAKPSFVTFDVPADVVNKIYEALSLANTTGKIRRGVNEATKAIERGSAKFIVIAEDVTPEEVIMHLPLLCKEKKIPYAFVPTKAELGKASGIDVPTSSLAVLEEGDSKKIFAEVKAKLDALIK
ncbi:MAG: 50S ribosomal protein L7Ae [Candidatus Aenigmatarchaeota archaeon]